MKLPAFPLIISDIIGFVLTFSIAYAIFILSNIDIPAKDLPNILSIDLLGFYTLQATIGILYFAQQGHYRLSTPWWQQVKHICVFSICSLLVLGFFFFVIKGFISRQFVILSWVGLIPMLMITRQLIRKILISMNMWNMPTVIIGGFENTIETIYALKSESYINYDIKKVIMPDAAPPQIKKFKEIHSSYKIENVIPKFHKNDFVVICPDTRRELNLGKITDDIIDSGADFALVPPIEGFSYYDLQPHFFFGYNIILLKKSIKLHSALNQQIKNLVDRVGAATGIMVLSPLFLYIAYKIRKDGGPAFYFHDRIGKNGKTFKCWKFRTMVTNSQEILKELLENDPKAKKEWDADFKLKNDPRITKIGKFLRKTSLDEIPQLYNVLAGEMSLVGPRPIVTDEVKFYGDKIKDYYSVRPGITGLWQVSGRNDVSYALRVYLDSWYVRHWSIWTDIVIIIRTISVVILKRGAY